MSAWSLPDIEVLCAHLMQTREVYAPKTEGAETHWQRLSEPEGLSVPPLRPLSSPKQFFFAERESLFAFEGGRFVERIPDASPTALFGITACDLVAITYQDRFFAEDAHYLRRRSAVLLVGMDCTTPCVGAFCHAMKSGPSVQSGTADLTIFPNQKGAQVLIAETTAGEAALNGLALLPAPADWAIERAHSEAQSILQMQNAEHIHAGISRINAGAVTAEAWEKIGLQCVACSGCTTACPTCSCFAPRDVPASEGEDFTRERVWDSCLFESFQREASGANPTASAGQRVERFWYHKLSDDFSSEFGRYGCVGCGRCDTVCPGAIGAHSVLRRLTET